MSRLFWLAPCCACVVGVTSTAIGQVPAGKQMAVACYGQTATIVDGGTSTPSIKGEGSRRNLSFLLTIGKNDAPHQFRVDDAKIHDPTNLLGGSQFTTIEIQSEKNTSGYFLSRDGKAVGSLVLMPSEVGKVGIPMLLLFYGDKAKSIQQKYVNGRCTVALGENAVTLFEAWTKQPNEVPQ